MIFVLFSSLFPFSLTAQKSLLVSFPQNILSIMYISLQREKDHAGLERKTQQGRHSADIRRVQKRLMISGPLGAGERIDRGILTNKLLLSRKACVRLCVCITVCADKFCFKITTGHFSFVKTFCLDIHNFEWLFEGVQCW